MLLVWKRKSLAMSEVKVTRPRSVPHDWSGPSEMALQHQPAAARDDDAVQPPGACRQRLSRRAPMSDAKPDSAGAIEIQTGWRQSYPEIRPGALGWIPALRFARGNDGVAINAPGPCRSPRSSSWRRRTASSCCRGKQERVVDAGVGRRQRARLLNITVPAFHTSSHGHAVDGRGLVLLGRGVGDVLAPITSGDVRGRELVVDVLRTEHARRRATLASARSTFMWPGMRPATGWMAYWASTPAFLSWWPISCSACCANLPPPSCRSPGTR